MVPRRAFRIDSGAWSLWWSNEDLRLSFFEPNRSPRRRHELCRLWTEVALVGSESRAGLTRNWAMGDGQFWTRTVGAADPLGNNDKLIW